MKVESILKSKGRHVETIQPDQPVLTAVHRLTKLGIGALVVTDGGGKVMGTISERDIVRGLLHHGDRLVDMRVSDVMSKNVPVCSPDDSIQDAMAHMTRWRHRHLPVVRDDELCGLVSIGDVVKNRLEEMELETNVLRDAYIARH